MRDTLKELALTGVLAAIAVTALVSINTTQRPSLSFQYASGLPFSTLPNIYAGLLLFLCLINAGLALSVRKKQAALPAVDRLSLIRAAVTIVLLLVFVNLIGKIPFVLLCAGFLGILFPVYGKRNVLQIAVITVIGAIVLHLIFVTALGLRL
ncbi:MAG: tripartite tricarboxylate transporter TctB family protein [Desulfovibrionaceae bacterium]|nr:tripartite tricarboxylate transporter TctB family protein [Desulfovibrionaceae bacterium]